MDKLKQNWYLLLIALVTVVLGVIAVVTAVKLYQLGRQPVAPTAPERVPAAVPDCTLEFTVAAPTETPTGTLSPTPTGTPTGTPTSTPTGTLSPTPTGTLTSTPTPTKTETPTPTKTETPTPTEEACLDEPIQDPPSAWCDGEQVCIRWAWEPVEGATQYRVIARNDEEIDTGWRDEDEFAWDGTLLSYDTCNLNSGVTYRGRVGARGACDSETWTDEETKSKECAEATSTPTSTLAPTSTPAVELPAAGIVSPTVFVILGGILLVFLGILL